MAVQGEVATEGEHADLTERRDRLQRGVPLAGHAHRPHAGGEQPLDAGLEAALLAVLLAEALDHADTGDRGLDDAGDLPGLLLRDPGGGEQVGAAAQRHVGESRADREGDQRQHRREHGHDDQRDHEQQGVAGEHRQEREQPVHDLQVRDRPAHHLPGRQRVEAGAVEPLQGGEHVAAHVALHVEGEATGAEPAGVADREPHDARAEQQDRPGPDRGAAVPVDEVDHVAGDERGDRGDDAAEDGGTERDVDVRAVPEAVADESAEPTLIRADL